jgi:single-strand DNA-binding protein
MGYLTQDPELRFTQKGDPVCNFNLAVNSSYKSGEEIKEEVLFIKIVIWGKQAEGCNEYLTKGKPAFVEGRLQSRSWETANGEKRIGFEVVASRVLFLENKPKEEKEETIKEKKENLPF